MIYFLRSETLLESENLVRAGGKLWATLSEAPISDLMVYTGQVTTWGSIYGIQFHLALGCFLQGRIFYKTLLLPPPLCSLPWFRQDVCL